MDYTQGDVTCLCKNLGGDNPRCPVHQPIRELAALKCGRCGEVFLPEVKHYCRAEVLEAEIDRLRRAVDALKTVIEHVDDKGEVPMAYILSVQTALANLT